MTTTPYTCTGQENQGAVELMGADGIVFNTIAASRCFAHWYCENNECTWQWRAGIDPDDPSTWPPEDPPADPPVATAPA